MIIITGASKGIGKFLFDELSKYDKVIGFYNKTKPENCDNYEQVDVTDEDSIKKFVLKYEDVLSDVVLIHCAGSNFNSMLHKLNLEDWNNVINTNLTSSFLLTKHLLPIMRKQSFGKIVFFSSVVPLIGPIGTCAYSSAKAGLWGLTKTISTENVFKNITCNTINLGYFDIGMIGEVPQGILDKVIDTIPMKRLGKPSDILRTVEYLVDTDYITGTMINVNGGLA